MIIRIKKNADGRTSLTCIRDDGTTTWQSLDGSHARFFPRHDLTHYAVETVLADRGGFYGLVDSGWDLTDFGPPWPKGRLPVTANFAEMIVGLLDLERATGHLVTADDINQRLSEFSVEKGLSPPPRIGEDAVEQIRRRRAELFSAWDQVEPGDVLELPF